MRVRWCGVSNTVPHHGRDRNATAEFHQAITAEHYVVSANGEHHNPDYDTFEWLGASRPARAKYTIQPTYLKSDEEALRQTLAKVKKQLPAVAKRIVAPKGKASSVKVDLAAPVSY